MVSTPPNVNKVDRRQTFGHQVCAKVEYFSSALDILVW